MNYISSRLRLHIYLHLLWRKPLNVLVLQVLGILRRREILEFALNYLSCDVRLGRNATPGCIVVDFTLPTSLNIHLGGVWCCRLFAPVFMHSITVPVVSPNFGFGHQILSNEYILLCQDGSSQVIND